MLTTACYADVVKVTLVYFISMLQWVGLGWYGPKIVIAHEDINIRRFLHLECTRTDAMCCLIHHKRDCLCTYLCHSTLHEQYGLGLT